MISIVTAGQKDAVLLSDLATRCFVESHGHSAPPADISQYINEQYNCDVLAEELQQPENIYHILYYHQQAAGYSKIIFNEPYEGSLASNIAKLERIYLLKQFYNLKLGSALFEFNLQLMKANNQSGTWLYVWKENQRALQFYGKQGFIINGSYDFKLSATHSNPNHRLLLAF
jgi:ribosomal protein S18 acetylase RimI-like enzyme